MISDMSAQSNEGGVPSAPYWKNTTDNSSTKPETSPTDLVPVTVEVNQADKLDQETSQPTPSVEPVKNKKRKKWTLQKKIVVACLLVALTIFGFGGFVLLSKTLGNASAITGQNAGDLFSGLLSNFNQKTTPLLGQQEGRTNFLIIGVDGSGYLADSITMVSYFYDTKEFTAIHIPRDLAVTSEYGTTKINEFFSYAEQSGERNGPVQLTKLLENEYGVTFHYWTQFNFYGVRDLIDTVGGVDVQVETDLVDCDYPADDLSLIAEGECIRFKQGTEKMDGRRALMYARSRQSTSDFDRGKRQSIVMESVLKAMLNDIKNKGTLFDINKLSKYLDVLGKNVRVSIKANELKSFYETFYNNLKDLSHIQFGKISWDTSSPIFTAGFGSSSAYRITYRDGTAIGQSGMSQYQKQAQEQVQDPRQFVIGANSSIKKASIVVLGNASGGKVSSVFQEVKKLGFVPCELCYDDRYSAIKTTKTPQITFYVSNESLRKEVEKALEKASFQYTVSGALPATKTLTSNNQGTDIIVWIE